MTRYFQTTIIVVCFLISSLCAADDTCIFNVSSSDVLPNIVILLDNGATVEEIVWHDSFDMSKDYTPAVGSKDEIVENGASGNGFFHSQGYGISRHEGVYYLQMVSSDLTLAGEGRGIAAEVSDTVSRKGTWTINGRTITLPAEPGTAKEAEGISDKAGRFRFSKEYLNWIFFSDAFLKDTFGNGSDLPAYSRLYLAKAVVMNIARAIENRAKIGIFSFTSDAVGATMVHSLDFAVTGSLSKTNWQDNALTTSFMESVNNLETVLYSPLAEGLASIGGYFNSSASPVVDAYCQKQFVIIISPGISSQDQSPSLRSFPTSLADYDKDGTTGEPPLLFEGLESLTVPVNLNGSTYLDDVAHYLYNNDIAEYVDGFQNVITYTIGFLGDKKSRLFLINTSNNGNGKTNLISTSDAEYGQYHFTAGLSRSLSVQIITAIQDILSRNATFSAPSVPVSRTTSNKNIYLTFFKPLAVNFWYGNMVKFGFSPSNEIIDMSGAPAILLNGTIREDAEPFWSTGGWADPAEKNYINNTNRKIFTYLGSSFDLTHVSNKFSSENVGISTALLGLPIHTEKEIINFVRGADVFDENSNGDRTENRRKITGDILHSEPLVVDYGAGEKIVYFGANDGMLHAVDDATGLESWAFIPPDLLPKLKDLVEGIKHQFFVDSSPMVYVKDVNGNGIIEGMGSGGKSKNDKDRVILVCGERQGGTGYFALDVTFFDAPRYLWRINQQREIATTSASGETEKISSSGILPPPTVILPELGESWSEPQIGMVKTSDNRKDAGTPVFFIGAGMGTTMESGKAVFAINILTGAVVRKFSNIIGMDYSIPSSVKVLDTDSNGFIDTVYVGDLGGQVWRFGQFRVDSEGKPLSFPDANENIHSWEAARVFIADLTYTSLRSFYNQPSVTLERKYNLVFIGSGDRNDPCDDSDNSGTMNKQVLDTFYAIKDRHFMTAATEMNLSDVTNELVALPDLDNEDIAGWFLTLKPNEKALTQPTVLHKTLYFSTFTPSIEVCQPGGDGKFYAMQYKSAAAVMDLDGNETVERSVVVGKSLPSRPIIVIPEQGEEKVLISVSEPLPEGYSSSDTIAVKSFTVFDPDKFHYLWWKEVFR